MEFVKTYLKTAGIAALLFLAGIGMLALFGLFPTLAKLAAYSLVFILPAAVIVLMTWAFKRR